MILVFHSFCCNVTLGAVSEETNQDFPAHQTTRVNELLQCILESEGQGTVYLYSV